jgi:predicted nuclease of predicted toxin-antitoxin system
MWRLSGRRGRERRIKTILDEADSDDRVLVTEDRDFGELVVRQRLKVRGIILLELDRRTGALTRTGIAIAPRPPDRRRLCWPD